jgi:nicotinate-nucleotide adenylyltransferase
VSNFAGATGILGGTFDPTHNGHVAVAVQCRALLGLAEVRLVPSAIPPHRPPPLAPAADRLAMAGLATMDQEGLVVDDLELRRGGTSYTVDTLEALRSPGRRLVLLLGYDAALDLPTWRRSGDLSALAEIVVFNRTGAPPGARDGELPPAAMRVEVDSPAISATEVRRRLAAREDLSQMLPAAVLEYIHDRGLYVTDK